MLEFTHASHAHTVLRHCLEQRMERMVLCLHDHEAIQAGFHGANVCSAYTLDGTKCYRKYNTHTCLPPPRNPGPPRLSQVALNIKELTELLAAAQAQAGTAQGELGHARQQYELVKQGFLVSKAACRNLKSRKGSLQSVLEDLMLRQSALDSAGDSDHEDAPLSWLARMDQQIAELNSVWRDAKQMLGSMQAATALPHHASQATQVAGAAEATQQLTQLTAEIRQLAAARSPLEQHLGRVPAKRRRRAR
ncbi:hypothetical protein WJX72_004322 [[Myrmecia] bisecta]|uniref:Uncharacterized protein n=1 Tax=[Myrmecia] bisecta TaxID=41462 RepID=A0AAW1Q087_9CHLO